MTARRVNGDAQENGHHPISVCEGHANMIERQAKPHLLCTLGDACLSKIRAAVAPLA